MRIFQNCLPIFLILASCSANIGSDELYGRWDYVKVENVNPQDSLPDGELEIQSPAIIFEKNNDLVIEWGGKKISSGKFRMDGRLIRYTENLPGNQKREFPFLIKSLNELELVFQTMEKNSTTITARKGEISSHSPGNQVIGIQVYREHSYLVNRFLNDSIFMLRTNY